MKKVYYILVLTILAMLSSCRNENESSDSANTNKINPPTWIKGKWKSDYDQYYNFTNNDIIIQFGGITSNIKPIADLGGYSQTSTDSEFTYTLHQLNITYTYKFKKINSTKILFDDGLGGNDYEMWSEWIKQ